MKLDLRWLALFISSLLLQEGLRMVNFALAPHGLYLYIPALFLGYSSSFVPFGIGFSSTVLLGLALDSQGLESYSLVPLVLCFCVLHYIQNQEPTKARRLLRRRLQPFNVLLWGLWVLSTKPLLSSFLHNPMPLLLSICCSQALLWATSLWYMDLQHRLIVPLQRRLKPSA